MVKKKAKTEGLEWVQHSLTAFNGSGYADMSTPETFLESYVTYKRWKKRPDAVELANMYWNSLLPLAEHLIELGNGPTAPRSVKGYKKFNTFINEKDKD